MITILYTISILVMLLNVICSFILIKSINLNKKVLSMNEIIESINKLRKENKFIIRDKNCNSLAYLAHVALYNGNPILIVDVDNNKPE